jgi:Transmembrane domain of unknown function (DUF3566)
MAIDPDPADARPTSALVGDATIAAPTAASAPLPDPAPVAVAPLPEASEPTMPAEAPSGRRGRRVKARQVQRVITRIDPWSMLKVSLLFALSLWLIVVVAGILLWRVAVSTGTIGNFENFLATALGEDSFTINGGQILQGSLVVGLVFFATGAIFAVVTSVLFNLIAGVVGGIRTTVIELETARPTDGP